MRDSGFSIRKRLKSFTHAFRGLKVLIKEEHNARIHLFAAICAIIAGIIFRISPYEWIAIVLSIGIVISLEIINSNIERISDLISPGKNDKIKSIKDLAAAAVLVASVAALVTGLIIFIPKIISIC